MGRRDGSRERSLILDIYLRLEEDNFCLSRLLTPLESVDMLQTLRVLFLNSQTRASLKYHRRRSLT